MKIFLSILILFAGCSAKNTVAVETTNEQHAETIVNNNRDWMGVGIVAGTLVTGYVIWEYIKWKRSSKLQEVTSENSSPEAHSTALPRGAE